MKKSFPEGIVVSWYLKGIPTFRYEFVSDMISPSNSNVKCHCLDVLSPGAAKAESPARRPGRTGGRSDPSPVLQSGCPCAIQKEFRWKKEKLLEGRGLVSV